ncbi:alpha-amylase family glycosyl hydrolase [Jeotgalibaca sp. A127]|uniref:alpha-amylase family glycosyl hydrolase n=1 Tax=Jeotgalibaca sp. A127 TaxID=3457324 RepID=UPI003FD5806D
MTEKRIILHAFQWRLEEIKNSLPQIHESGFNAIQISPIAPTKDEDSQEFWVLYQPTHFKVGNKQIGSRQDLIDLCQEAEKYGIAIIADVVLRHLAGADDGRPVPHPSADPTITGNPDYWLPQFESEDMECRENIIHGCFGLPAINYYHPDIQSKYITFLGDLIACGVDSFRIDMGKHFALPEEGCDFWTNVIARYGDRFNYAENLNCPTELQDKYAEHVGILGSEPCSDNSKFVAHFETHDTYYTFYSTIGMTNRERLDAWEWLLQTNENVLWFSRPYDDLTFADELAEMNRSYLKEEVR